MLETTQQLFYDALDKSNVDQAQPFFEKGGKLIENYYSNFYLVDFKEKIPSEWGIEFINTYSKMHEWHKKFLEAKKQKNDSIYKKLRLDSFELMLKIPHAKSQNFRNEIENILFGFNPEIDKLEKKSAEAGKEAYQIYFVQKTNIGEYPNEIWRKIK